MVMIMRIMVISISVLILIMRTMRTTRRIVMAVGMMVVPEIKIKLEQIIQQRLQLTN